MYRIFFLICVGSLSAMQNNDEELWDLDRYFETKELVRWGVTTPEKAQQYLNDGQGLWNDLIKGLPPLVTYEDNDYKAIFDQKKELTKRVTLCWYLYSKALEQKKPFYNGMFVIKDTDEHAVYNFFYEYVANTIDTMHENPVYYSTNPFSYARHSTHFKNNKIKNTEYGIDIRYNIKEWSCYDLPSGCSHILFGKLKENQDKRARMYLKMEDAGLYVTELPYHISGVFTSCARKTLPYIVGTHIASKIITPNDGKFCQKEHLPNDILDLYYQICREKNIDFKKCCTITDFWEHVIDQKDDKLSTVKEHLHNNYSDLKERFGNEIIIDTNCFD